jgi:hypothetical protein
MRRVRAVAGVAAGVVLLLAGCSSSTSKPSAAISPVAAPPTTAPADSASQPVSPAETCATPLPDKGDVIVREIFPNVPVDALDLGGTDPEHCVWTMDSLKTSQPSGPGYCSQVAWASDNPGYDADTVPAPPLKNVQETIGDCN